MLSYFEVFRVPTLPRSIGELQGNRKGLPLQSAESKYVTRLRWLLSVGFTKLLVIALISACGGTTGGQGSQQLTPMTLALDWTPNTNHTGIYVALAKNWYRDQRIDLKLLPYSSSVTPDTLVANGKADVGIGFTEGVVADAAVNQPVVSIAAIIQHNTSALVTLASSGITRPRDLDGKTYGGFGAPYETPVISLVFSSQDFLSLRYAEPGHKWGIQDISAWRNYPTFILDAGGVTDASGKPVKSLNLNTFYTNQFLS